MVWVVGSVGLVLGFAMGQMLLLRWLKDRSRDELLNDKSLRLKYGLFNWIVAGSVCVCCIWIYRYYFPAL